VGYLSHCDKTSVSWISTTNSNNDLYVTIKYKTCGLCSKYVLVNTFLNVNAQQSSYYKPSKRLYVHVENNWHNVNVTFY
jgi:hypothetical protein